MATKMAPKNVRFVGCLIIRCVVERISHFAIQNLKNNLQYIHAGSLCYDLHRNVNKKRAQ